MHERFEAVTFVARLGKIDVVVSTFVGTSPRLLTMPQLNREVALWSHPMGTRAMPTSQSEEEWEALADDVLPFETKTVRFIGVCPAGTSVTDVVDIGEPHHVRCTLVGQRVTTVKWAISDQPPQASQDSQAVQP